MSSFLSRFTPYSFPLLGLVRLPTVSISIADKKAVNLSAGASNLTFLKTIAWAGYKAKLKAGKFAAFTEDQVKERLRMEFAVFEKTGITDYLLLVWDILQWCDKQNIDRGPGRGSVCGSLTCFFIGITKVDPLKRKLNFTRFLSEARAKPKIIDGIIYADGKNLCDIDSDISFIDRPRVIKYVEEKHAGKTCKISTRLQLTGKTALKDTLKSYLEYNEGEAKRVTDNIESLFGKVEDLDKALEHSKELQAWVAESPRHRKAYDMARAIEGLNIAKGQHPSGVLISYEPLDGNIPTELSKTKDVVTAYDMNVAVTQAVKIDLLGLRSIDTITETCRHIGIKMDDIDVEHPSIYDYIDKSDHYLGLFQIEDGLTKQVARKAGPRTVEGLAAVLALSRPGSLRFIDDFVKFVKDGTFKPIFPAIDQILLLTGNILLYQEQINDVCQQVYKLSAVDADEVRRAIGKKVKEDMAKWEPVLYANGKTHGIPDDVTKYFWDVCNASADYLFSVNHSTAYSYITAMTTYLKANHPNEFTLALLKMSRHEPNSQTALTAIIAEAKQLGVDILPPDIVKSSDDFSVEGAGVRFGLSHIRGISDANMVKLMSFRREFATKFDIFNAAQEAGITISVLVGLIMCGCIDPKGITRAKLALEAQLYNVLTPREMLLVRKVAGEFNEDLISIVKALGTKTDEKGRPYIKESRLMTLRRDFGPYQQMFTENSRNEELTCFLMERHYLGFSYTSTLKDIYSKRIDGLMTVSQVLAEPANIKVRFVAFIDEVNKSVSLKSKKPYVKFWMSDETGRVYVMLHGNDNMEAVRQFDGSGEMPAQGDIIVVNGSKGDGTMVFCGAGTRRDESFMKQTNPVKMKKGDLEVVI